MNITLGTYHTTPAIREAVNAVLDSGRLSYGPVTREYERRFAEMHGCAYGVASNSGTSSLVVALQALKELHGWSDGDEVICPALTFVATINAVLHNRLTPVLVDVELDCYGIDTNRIESAITPRTRCIMPVHLFGQPCDMVAVVSIAKLYGLKIVEDSCETIGATLLGRAVGGWGDIGCFSTYMAHTIVTGVGGLSVTNNPDYATKMRSLCNHGLAFSELPTGGEYEPTMLARKFKFDSVGHSFRITEIEAAIGLAQINEWMPVLSGRQCSYWYYRDRMSDLEDYLLLPKKRPGVTLCPMMYTVQTRKETKHGLMKHLADRGIEVRDAVPLTTQPVYKGLFNPGDYPVANHINEYAFYWGCHQDLSIEQLDAVVQSVYGYFGVNPNGVWRDMPHTEG